MTTNIAEDIDHYFFFHFSELQKPKQIHWLFRHYLWFRDDFSKNELDLFRPTYTANQKSTITSYNKILRKVPRKKQKKGISSSQKKRIELLQDYYPRIERINILLFKTLFSSTIFKKDQRKPLITVVPRSEILALRSNLRKNPEHIFHLSTPAINFLYISEWAYKIKRIDPKFYLKLVTRAPEGKKPDKVLMTLYLLTHCIIGETRFYSRRISHNKSTYKKMLKVIDQLIQKHYSKLPLDIKVESLLCAKFLKIKLKAEPRILQEVNKSKDGQNFIIDRFNSWNNKRTKSLTSSEHRNILLVMAMNDLPQHLQPLN